MQMQKPDQRPEQPHRTLQSNNTYEPSADSSIGSPNDRASYSPHVTTTLKTILASSQGEATARFLLKAVEDLESPRQTTSDAKQTAFFAPISSTQQHSGTRTESTAARTNTNADLNRTGNTRNNTIASIISSTSATTAPASSITHRPVPVAHSGRDMAVLPSQHVRETTSSTSQSGRSLSLQPTSTPQPHQPAQSGKHQSLAGPAPISQSAAASATGRASTPAPAQTPARLPPRATALGPTPLPARTPAPASAPAPAQAPASVSLAQQQSQPRRPQQQQTSQQTSQQQQQPLQQPQQQQQQQQQLSQQRLPQRTLQHAPTAGPQTDGKEEQKQAAVTTRTHHDAAGLMTTSQSTVLRYEEVADLQRFHDNSLAVNSRKAYQSDYQSFVRFLTKRFPTMPQGKIAEQCTLEHVLAYLNQLCTDGKQISTINRRLSTIKKHILPTLFTASIVPGSRQELIHREMDAIVRGIRRTIGAEHRTRGKRPLLIENIIEMCKVAALATDEDGRAMPNTRCRDVCLLLFLFFSAMRRSEVEQLMWSDLTFDARGVMVHIRRSKTDKEAKGQTIAISRLEGTDRATHCPVKALETWKVQSSGSGESPVFRWISRKDEVQWRVLIDQRIVAILKHYAGLIGLDSKCFAAHSTRSGYVTSSSDRGVPISEIMKRTRHQSLSSVSVYMKSEELFSSSGDRKL